MSWSVGKGVSRRETLVQTAGDFGGSGLASSLIDDSAGVLRETFLTSLGETKSRLVHIEVCVLASTFFLAIVEEPAVTHSVLSVLRLIRCSFLVNGLMTFRGLAIAE